MRRVLTCATAAIAMLLAACGGPPTPPTGVVNSPVVQSVSPNSGPITGGTTVTIRGQNFAAGATVTIGGQTATDVTVQDALSLTARTPAGGTASAVDVTVVVSGRSGVLPGGFTYQAAPPNNVPTIVSIAAAGTRPNEPANFADLGETIRVTATVRDDETALDQLEYNWKATIGGNETGTFSGTGASVTWRAPDAAAGLDPAKGADVTITLKVVEKYGPGGAFQHEVTGTRTLSLHNSTSEVGDMAVRFLTEFSKPETNRDWRDIMRDFNFTGKVCPVPGEVDDEHDQVVTHYENFTMLNFRVDRASSRINFRGTCEFDLPGDACIAVGVFWNSRDNRNGSVASTSGVDYLTAVYAPGDSRWWLCSSRYTQTGNLGPTFYSIR
jgi:IPT/TIG domain-containing protein